MMQGRILVFSIKNFKLQLVSEKEVKGAAYNVNPFQACAVFSVSEDYQQTNQYASRLGINKGRQAATCVLLLSFTRKPAVLNIHYGAGEAHSRHQQQSAAVQMGADR